MGRRLEVGVLYPKIEEQLLQVHLVEPKGNASIWRENNEKWT